MLCLLITIIAAMFFGIVEAATVNSAMISVSLVNQDPDPAVPGDVLELRLGIENTGSEDANNLFLEFVPTYPFEEISGEKYKLDIGTLKAYQYDNNMKIIKFKVRVNKDATAGTYPLTIKEYKEGKESATITPDIDISIKSNENAEIIYIDKSVLIPGKEDSLKFTIHNVGGAPLRDLTFSWLNADKVILPVGSDNTKYIRYIDVGDSAELLYHVIANTNADAGLYELSLKLSYSDSTTDVKETIETIAGVYVGGGTDFDVAFSETTNGQTSFTIANVGSNPASSVSVVIPQQPGWRTTGSNSMIIGNLNTGDYTVASFAVQSNTVSMPTNTSRQPANGSMQRVNLQGQNNNLKMQIVYTDTMGRRETVEKTVTMNMQSTSAGTASGIGSSASGYSTNFRATRQQSFFAKYKTYIIFFVVIIALGFVFVYYSKYKKGKLENPNFKVVDLFRKKEIKNKLKK